jgi:hypothetical protein
MQLPVHLGIRIPREPVEKLFFPAENAASANARRVDRPSIMSELEQEIRRRAEAGQLAPTLKAECRNLEEWAREQRQLQGRHIPTAKSIGDKLGSLFLGAERRGNAIAPRSAAEVFRIEARTPTPYCEGKSAALSRRRRFHHVVGLGSPAAIDPEP